mgnify:CR=1 FL=1
MRNWFLRGRSRERTAPRHLNNVIAGTGFYQRMVGYVDDFSGVYDLDLRQVGSVDSIAANEEHAVRTSGGKVVGFVGGNSESANAGNWHQVYDTSHSLVGLVDNASEMDSPDGRTLGSVVYNQGNGGTGWRRAGAALLLLIK